jgi:hypothetical protein
MLQANFNALPQSSIPPPAQIAIPPSGSPVHDFVRQNPGANAIQVSQASARFGPPLNVFQAQNVIDQVRGPARSGVPPSNPVLGAQLTQPPTAAPPQPAPIRAAMPPSVANAPIAPTPVSAVPPSTPIQSPPINAPTRQTAQQSPPRAIPPWLRLVEGIAPIAAVALAGRGNPGAAASALQGYQAGADRVQNQRAQQAQLAETQRENNLKESDVEQQRLETDALRAQSIGDTEQYRQDEGQLNDLKGKQASEKDFTTWAAGQPSRSTVLARYEHDFPDDDLDLAAILSQGKDDKNPIEGQTQITGVANTGERVTQDHATDAKDFTTWAAGQPSRSTVLARYEHDFPDDDLGLAAILSQGKDDKNPIEGAAQDTGQQRADTGTAVGKATIARDAATTAYTNTENAEAPAKLKILQDNLNLRTQELAISGAHLKIAQSEWNNNNRNPASIWFGTPYPSNSQVAGKALLGAQSNALKASDDAAKAARTLAADKGAFFAQNQDAHEKDWQKTQTYQSDLAILNNAQTKTQQYNAQINELNTKLAPGRTLRSLNNPNLSPVNPFTTPGYAVVPGVPVVPRLPGRTQTIKARTGRAFTYTIVP